MKVIAQIEARSASPAAVRIDTRNESVRAAAIAR